MPLIGGRNLENVTITGRGVLTTDNAEWLKATARFNKLPELIRDLKRSAK